MYEDLNANYALNSYLWKLLEVNLGWDRGDYGGGAPIIPTAQQPELMQTGKSFIVYGSAAHPATSLYALRTDSISYNIYSPSSTEANRVVNLLRYTFDRQDEAADDVNGWLGIEGEPGNRPKGYRDVQFLSIRTIMSERAVPADEEGGYVAAFIMLEVKYVVPNDTAVTTGFTYN